MRVVPFVFLAALLASSCVARELRAELSAGRTVDTENYGLTGRIVNGTKAILRQFPHQVSLRRSWSSKHFCGGALITVNHVLTAAHCMYQDSQEIEPWTIMVVAGELQLNKQTSTGQRRGVETITIHSEFNLNTLQNDIAILGLAAAFKLTPEIQKVALPSRAPVPGTVCQVSGWGYPAADFPIVSNDLMYVELPVIEPQVCRKLLENETDFPPGMFCAGYLEGGKDACQGDSGGGMICNGVLTGIVSGGNGCAYPRYPGVYNDVHFYEHWISNFSKSRFMVKRSNSANGVNAYSIASISLIILASVFTTSLGGRMT